ncbi:MAG: hypothetical protein AAGE05_04460 [Pseudomonadota bacterium]
MKRHENPAIDNERLARMLAATAGVDWTSLPDYPGYGKNYWREKARKLFGLDPSLAR